MLLDKRRVGKIKLLGFFPIIASLCLSPEQVFAADCGPGFPSKPVNFLVGFAPGGGTDLIARVVATAIEQKTGWRVIVENKPGAGGGSVAAGLKKASPDGYSIGVTATNSISLVPYTSPEVQFEYPDFDYLATSMQTNYGLVAASDRPYKTLEQFAAYAKEKGRATVSTTGIGQDAVIKKISEHFKVNLIPIAGAGAAEAMKDVLGGHIDATLQGTLHVEQIKSGKIVQLASLIDQRVDYAPDSKTLKESGLDYSLDGYTLFFTTKGIPQPIKACLAQSIDDALHSPPFADLMNKLNGKARNLGIDGTYEHVKQIAIENQQYFKK